MNALGALKDILFPQVRCLACDEPRDILPGSALCRKCEAGLPALAVPDAACGQCRTPGKAAQPCAYCLGGGMRGLERAYAPYLYRGAARQLIVRLKFGPYALAAGPLTGAMARAVSGQGFDAMVPVPLYAASLRERGVNQSRLLCEGMQPTLHLPIIDALKKTRPNRRQSGLDAKRRADNVRGVFAVVGYVRGLRVLLVDDVRTTGSTARECARVLIEAGAASVSLLTAAVAVRGRDNREEG